MKSLCCKLLSFGLLSGLVVAGVACSGATQGGIGAQDVSSTTSISISMPPKSSLPTSVQKLVTNYHFIISSLEGGVGQALVDSSYAPSSQDPCGVVDKLGDYTESLKLDAKLKSNCTYMIEVVLGQADANGNLVGAALAPIPSASAPSYSVAVYQGYKQITPADMTGKSQLAVNLQLERLDAADPSLPSTLDIGNDIDVSVKVTVPDASASAKQPIAP